ncbi:MAG: 4-(cytidine 5'-diphospho)-2-C-methyl-D-erythritol kinase [Rhodobacteraceae bacterium]|nr:MAG: 4-(cytidine 5'-diphospho)-2-C-methyl-D-erythritol kinase [Paracoccaceae bacterium]
MQINGLACAKVNLCLHVIGQRSDGYHLLDSLVVFADFGDEITVEASADLHLKISGPFRSELSSPDNLILSAAKMLSKNDGAAVHLVKKLPVSSGIGGGSADAATTLKLLSKLWNIPLSGDYLRLGADVPVCLLGQATRLGGVGDQLTPIHILPELPCVLINPRVAVSTPQIFSQLSCKNGAGIGDIPQHQLTLADAVEWISDLHNDLQNTAISYAPKIDICLQDLKGQGALLARMSGSGATCFGLFETEQHAQNAATALAEKHPDFWVQSCVLNS